MLSLDIARFSVKREAAKGYLGLLWWFADPAINALLYWFLVVVVFRSADDEFVPFVLLGLVIWRWIQQSVTGGSNAIYSNSGLMRTVHIPKLVFVFKEVTVAGYRFVFGFAAIMVIYFLLGYFPTVAYFLLPIQFAATLVMILGLASLLSSLVPFFPDTQQFLPHAFRVLMFVSGVFYSQERLPEKLVPIYRLNPFSGLVDGFRAIMMRGEAPDFPLLIYAASVGLACGLVGFVIHMKYNRLYPRIIAA